MELIIVIMIVLTLSFGGVRAFNEIKNLKDNNKAPVTEFIIESK
jgi:hypothetical protein